MQLDSFTVVLAGVAVLVLEGSAFLFFWLRDRASRSLLSWGLAFILGGTTILFYAAPGWETNFVSIAFGNAARMIAMGLLWQGIRQFESRRFLLLPLVAVGVLWLGLCLVPWFAGSLLARVVGASVLTAALAGLAAWELWRDRDDRLPSRRPLTVAFASFASLMLVRAVVAAIAPFPFGAEAADPVWVGAYMLVVFIHVVFAAILFFAMTRERREAEQRNFALSDPLTGLMNRRAFTDLSQRLARRRAGVRSPLALLVLDLDHFKSVNDRYGHEIGDRLLVSFAEVAELNMRPTDQLFRMGGEEFCFVLPDTELNAAIQIGERIREAFAASVVDTAMGPASGTVSIGIAATQHLVALDVLLAAADAAVYEAKARGRNRIVVAAPPTLHSLTADLVAPARLRA